MSGTVTWDKYCIFSADNCTHGDIRLLNGTVPSEGRVEVCIGKIWGTVASDFWDNRDARVVCGQLGYSTRCKYSIIILLLGS